MSEEKTINIGQKGEAVYKKIATKLRKKYPGNYFVAIEPTTGKYFVGKDTIDAGKKARKAFPRKTFFGAHVGYLSGRV